MNRQSPAGVIRVTRGPATESEHRVHVAVTDASGTLVASVGDPGRTGFLRSAAKPWQALPLVEEGVLGALGLTRTELALCCASHNTEPEHVEVARSILAKAGRTEDVLGCGPHLPIREERARELLSAGETLGSIHNNCSGKHAGMVALAVHLGQDPKAYWQTDHPVQQRMLREVTRWTGLSADTIPMAADGCGVPTYSVSVLALAAGFARFAASGGDRSRVVEAMTQEPFMVAGTGRLCTDLMRVAGASVYCKTGAEGVYGAGAVDGRYGIGIKVEDGAKRASQAALLHVLAHLELIGEPELDALAEYVRAPVHNTLDDVVGEVRPEFDLEWV